MAQPGDMKFADFQRLYERLDAAERLLERGVQTNAAGREEVLRARALSLSKVRDIVVKDTLDVLAFRVGGESYAVPIEQVDQVVAPKQLSSLPGIPRHVLGAMVSRSRVVLVMDLRPLLGLEGGGMSDLTRVVVVNVLGSRFGLAAEEVAGRQELLRSTLGAPVDGPFLQVTSDRLAVLDLNALANRISDTTGR